ncbi:MAG: cation-translocating P-type ATPase [Deltaproteobacteria bacterium]|nr:cation-translocating P-type ATPase [Deltaproteobacteria bacterium]
MVDGIDLNSVPHLSALQATRLLEEQGYNELPSSRKRTIWDIASNVIREPMFVLLVSCGVIYLLLGNPKEAAILLGFVMVVMGITLQQEKKAERALEALRDLSSPRALVIRDNQLKRIPGREVVCGDLTVLSEGDRVPADGVLLYSLNLMVDESILTGESVPVRKISGDDKCQMKRAGGEDIPCVYSGTMIVQGNGIARVRSTGVNTEIGKIGKTLQELETTETTVQKETRILVRNIAVVGLTLCAVVVTIFGLRQGNWLNAFLAGITLAMATLPEEFPVVLTIFFALGAWRISKINVLTRKVTAIETLGSATVLCVDKTGTLTENQMSVIKLCVDGMIIPVNADQDLSVAEEVHKLLEFGILAGNLDPFDPMEKALKKLGERFLANSEHLHDRWKLVRQYPLSKELLSIAHVWKSGQSQEFVVAAKGAPEAIVDLCHMDETRSGEIVNLTHSMASEGLRVLGVAKTSCENAPLPDNQHNFPFEFIGLIGFADPIRTSVPSALIECYEAGLRVIMITGDYPDTAQSIARQIGLKKWDQIITGAEMDIIGAEELRDRLKTVNVFARAVPEQKLRIVDALKANGEIVAMTGDGVNDAPALKAAHIGIAMGGRGADVARESAELVLLNDDFLSIVETIKIGRRIYDNLRKTMAYIFAIHVPIAGMSFIPILLGWPLVLYPVHVAFLELIIDPACSLVFEAEPEESDVMRRPPRRPNEKLFGTRMIGLSLLQGVGVLLVVALVYAITLYRGHSEPDARALTFTTLVVANLGLILANRSWSKTIIRTLTIPNKALWAVIAGTLVFLGVVLSIPTLQDLFHFSQLHVNDLVLCFSAGILSILWFEGLKVFRNNR